MFPCLPSGQSDLEIMFPPQASQADMNTWWGAAGSDRLKPSESIQGCLDQPTPRSLLRHPVQIAMLSRPRDSLGEQEKLEYWQLSMESLFPSGPSHPPLARGVGLSTHAEKRGVVPFPNLTRFYDPHPSARGLDDSRFWE